MPLKFGSRQFAPTLLGTLLMLAMLAVLLSLGRWQLHRAAAKQSLYDEFAAGAGSTLVIDQPGAVPPRFQHVAATGHYDAGAQVLVDNMTSADGRAGYYVITPFQTRSGEWLLVNRGWVPMGADRSVLPAVPAPQDERRIRGRVDHLPAPGIRMGTPQPLAPPFPIRATYPTPSEIHAVLSPRRWSARADVILLDEGEPDGFLRQWAAPGIPPMRHVAYAVQWFGLAAALVILYLVSSLKT